MPNMIHRTEDRVAIQRLKARYCRYVDLHQWPELRALFTDDARFDGFGSAPPGSGPDTFVEGVAARLGPAVSVHHCHMPDIVFDGPDRARAVWAMEDYVEWPSGTEIREAGDGACGFRGYGFYEDAYVRTDAGWRIAVSRLTRIRLDPVLDQGRAIVRGWSTPRTGWIETV